MENKKMIVCPKCGHNMILIKGYDAIQEKNWFQYRCTSGFCFFESDYRDSEEEALMDISE